MCVYPECTACERGVWREAMKPHDTELIERARSVRGRFRLREGFCAEVAAAAEMLKHHETRVLTVVAVGNDDAILPPCGRCREMLVQIDPRNLDCRVLLHGDREATLSELLPGHWLQGERGCPTI